MPEKAALQVARESCVRASIIVPTKNEEKNIGACLRSVYGQKADFDFEVIVIDSGSRDGTVEIAREHPVKLVQIQEGEFHHGRTRNLGASQALGDYCVFLSADAIPATPEWLSNLLRNFDDPAVAGVYGRQLPKPEATPERVFFMQRRYGPARIVKSGKPQGGSLYRHYQFSTVNSAIRREVWSKTRFPEDLNAYEDIGIAIRILQRSFSLVYDPEAAVYHSHNYSLLYSFKQYFDTGVVYNHYRLWDPEHKRALRGEGLSYFLDEMRYLVSQGALVRCPYVACYELARYLGIVLGRNERLLPTALKKRLSSHRLFA